MVKVEEDKGENRKEGYKCEVVESRVSKELSDSHVHVKTEKKGLFYDKLLPKNYFARWLEKKTFFDGIRRKICCFENRDIELEVGSSLLKLKYLPKKFKDLGSFTIFVSIGDLFVGNALLDLWSSINLMPLNMLRKIGNLEVKPTKIQLQLADRTTKHPYGAAEDVLMKVDKFMFLVDFVILDMKEDEEVLLILDRPFMKTVKVIVDVDKGELRVRSHDEEVRFNLFDDATKCIADKNERQKEISKDGEQMEGSKAKEKVTRHEKLEAKGDQKNQEELVEGDEYRLGQPIMLNACRVRGRKKTKKLWVIKELRMAKKIEVKEPYSRRTKAITKTQVEKDNYPP